MELEFYNVGKEHFNSSLYDWIMINGYNPSLAFECLPIDEYFYYFEYSFSMN